MRTIDPLKAGAPGCVRRRVPARLSPTTRTSATMEPVARLPRVVWVKVPFTLTSNAAAGSRTDLKNAAITSSGACVEGPGVGVVVDATSPLGRRTTRATMSSTIAAATPPAISRDRGDSGRRSDWVNRPSPLLGVPKGAAPSGAAAAGAGRPGALGGATGGAPGRAKAAGRGTTGIDAGAGEGSGVGCFFRPKRLFLIGAPGPPADSTVPPAARRQ